MYGFVAGAGWSTELVVDINESFNGSFNAGRFGLTTIIHHIFVGDREISVCLNASYYCWSKCRK